MVAVGTQFDRYTILAPLGAGGMGEVYRARDCRLDRDVAIKVLPQQFAQDRQRLARFEREAKALAALAHPNILVLYDFGTIGQTYFAVMELLEGHNLRRSVAQGTTAWRQVVEWGIAIADGLAAAHAKGIIHRDLKPENLFLTLDGRLKILDFGLARMEAKAPADGTTAPFLTAQTDPGVVMGTVGYMSPEQVRGESVDTRSDIFSLGCVLCELATGRRPFVRKTAADTLAAILHDAPSVVGDSASPLPPEFQDVIERCLAKPTEQRIASARELAQELRALTTDPHKTLAPTRPVPTPEPQGRKGIQALAVLPFVNAGADPEMEYLSDGLTESLIAALSNLPKLRVMARSTVFRYKGQDADATEVGRALNVHAVLTGRVTQRGGGLIIQAELVAVADGSRLWGGRYNRPLAEIVTMEEQVAGEIAAQLRPRLTGAQKKRLARRQTSSPEAHQLYLQGRYHWNKRTEQGLKKSVQLFEQAINKDPAYALAYAGLADAYLNLGGWGYLPFRQAYPRAKAAALRALEFDDKLAEAHVSLAMAMKEYDWDWTGAGKEYQRALELNPNYAIAHQWYGEYLAAIGRHDEAIAVIQRAIDLDPLSLIIHSTLGRHGYYFARQYDRAIEQLKKTLEMDASFWVAHHFLGWVYAQVERFDEALAEFEAARRLNENLEIMAGIGFTQALAGRRNEANQVLDEFKRLAATRYVSPILPGMVAIALGENDQAFAWLEKAYADRVQMLSEINADPAFDRLRSDPRFHDLLRRVGFAACS